MNSTSFENKRFFKPAEVVVIIIVFMFYFLEGFSTDCFIPALPAISNHFKIQIGFAQIAISVYFLGYFALLFYGYLSDHFGRKKILLLSGAFFILGGILCVFAENYMLFLLGRFLQGMGICALSLNRAIFCDIFSRKQLKSIYSLLRGIFIVAASIAPLVGGYLKTYFGWRSIFVVVLALGIGMFLIVLLKYPETLNKDCSSEITLRSFISKMEGLFKNSTFIISALCNMLCYAAIYIVFAISPFLFQHLLGWSTVKYGYLAFSIPIMLAVGAMLNNLTLKKFAEITIISRIIWGGAMLSLLLIINAFVIKSTFLIILSLLGFSLICGAVMPNTFLFALNYINKDNDAGVSFTVFSLIRIIGVSLIVFLTSLLHSQSAITMGTLLLVISTSIIVLLLAIKDSKNG